jgi:hypothetical protein
MRVARPARVAGDLMATDMKTEKTTGLGKSERRRMIRRWKSEGVGLSLKQWAHQNDLVGDAAQAWLTVKKGA